MNLRRFLICALVFVIAVLAACDSTTPPTEPPTATLRGAIVPTRITPTATETFTPSPTPTETPTDTPDPTATNTPTETATSTPTIDAQATADAVATAEEQARLDAEATENAIAELNAQATAEEQTRLDGQATEQAQATRFAQATLDAQALLDAQATLNAQIAALNAQATQNAESTQNAQITLQAQGTADAQATSTQVVVNTQAAAGATTNAQATLDAASVIEVTPGTPTGNTLAYGDSVVGTIEGSIHTVEYTFEARAGDVVNIELARDSGDLDPFVALRSPDGRELIWNDDRGEDDYDSFIEGFTIPEAGTYTVVATRFNRELGTTQGEFRLTLQREGDTRTGAGESHLRYGDSTRGEIRGTAGSVLYTFTAQQGDVVGIWMNRVSGNLDPFVALRDPDGNEIAQNDDDPQGGTTNAYLRDFSIPADGVYTIVATRFNRELGTTEGQFEVIFEGTSATESAPTIRTDGTIEIGGSVTGSITQENFYQLYEFRGEAQQVVSITMIALTGDLDPHLILLDPDGREVARNDDRPEDTNAMLGNITLPAGGNYIIVAGRYQKNFGSSTGTFRLELRESTGAPDADMFAVPAELDTTVSGTITRDNPVVLYTVHATAGDVVTIHMMGVSANVDPYLILEDRFGNEMIRNDDSPLDENNNSNAMLSHILMPYTGYYSILATVYQDSDGNFGVGQFSLRITLEESAAPGENVPQTGFLFSSYSYGLRADQVNMIYYGVGDWTDGQQTDFNISTLLTFQLPRLPEGAEIENGTLDLRLCYLTSDDIFEQFGTLAVLENATFTSSLQVSGDINENAPTVGTLDDCTTVDVTDQVQAAYEAGQTFIQFRLVFPEVSVLPNNQIDSVIFVSPQLEVLAR